MVFFSFFFLDEPPTVNAGTLHRRNSVYKRYSERHKSPTDRNVNVVENIIEKFISMICIPIDRKVITASCIMEMRRNVYFITPTKRRQTNVELCCS